MLEFQSVCKTYRASRSHRGFAAVFRGLFVPAYDTVRAMQDVTFKIDAGELVGLIGENGAGKSTLVKLATGILRPDEGRVFCGGLEVWRNRKKCALRYGAVFGQRRSLWWQLTAKESLEALGRIYRLGLVDIKRRIEQLIAIFQLEEFVNRQVRQLSLGQRIRCEVAGCFIHSPQIVFLDEPTIGIDAVAKLQMRQYLRRINQEDGVAVLFTSHDLFDVERLCKRIMILDRGSLILNATFEQMRKKFGSLRVLKLTLASPLDDRGLAVVDGINLRPGKDPWRPKIRFDPNVTPAINLMAELQKRLDIVDFTVEDMPIDEFVAGIYQARNIKTCGE